uniref:Uncharacterized protein n=1 Tax=Rhizophora mucronata TaxID=61149 RepID=A0A2P2PC93_RHIMU
MPSQMIISSKGQRNLPCCIEMQMRSIKPGNEIIQL